MTEIATENNIKKDLSEHNFNHIIDLLYNTLEDETAWNKFFHAVNDSIGSTNIHMFAQDLHHGAISWSNGNDMPAEGELDLIHKYQFIDPRAQFIYCNPPFKWFHDHEHFDEKFMAENQFYQEFLAPWGLKYVTVCKVLENEQATILFGALSSPEQGPLPKDSVEFLNRLLPHISRVCRINLQNFIYSTQALVGTTLVNKLRQPVLLISTTREVVHINESANSLLKKTKLISIKNNQLVFPGKYNEAFYEECVSMEYAFKNVNGAQYRPEFKFIKINSSGKDESLYAFYSLLLPQSMMGVFGMRPLIMIFFYHPNSAPKVDSTILTAAFGLTPGECKTAILLAEGFSQKDIADKLGIKHDTVRKQLQTIYHKTSTNQQSELIRLMLHLPSNFVEHSETMTVSNYSAKKIPTKKH